MTQDQQRSNRRQVSDAILWLVAALLATYVGVELPLPYKVIAPVFAVATLVVALRIFRLASRGDHTMLVWLAGTAGLLGGLLFGGIAVSQLILWEATGHYEQCVATALTETARAACEAQYSVDLRDGAAPR